MAIVVTGWAFIAATVFFVSGRALFALSFGSSLILGLAAISTAKFAYLRHTLHGLDLYFYLRPTEIGFFVRTYPSLFAKGLGATLAFASILWWSFRCEQAKHFRYAFLLVVASGSLLAGAYAWRGERSKVYHFYDGYHASALLASAPEALEVALRGGLLQGSRTAQADISAIRVPDPLPTSNQTKPDIILILHESTFPVDLYPIACNGPVPERLYRSSDGRRRKLKVETFGGATWISEYGVMLGVSTYYFGEARNFLGYFLKDQLPASLIGRLKHSNYKTVAFYPSPGTFVNTSQFYRHLGFDEVLDSKSLGAPSDRERDRFYYEKVLQRLREHVRSGSQDPFFGFTWTMLSHSPYGETKLPEEGLKPDCTGNPEWDEYIRRLLISEHDLNWFVERLRVDFPERSFLIAGFGDHQPFIAQEFLQEQLTNTQNVQVIPTRNSKGYETFYRIEAINFLPDWASVPAEAEIPYLGGIIANAARITRSKLDYARDALAADCGFRYYECADQDRVLRFHDIANALGLVAGTQKDPNGGRHESRAAAVQD